MPSIISADLKVTGDLVSDGDIQVDGVIEGDIQSRTVTVGEAAHVKGSISADTVRVCGSVSGQVKGTNVTLAKTAKVTGDILHQTLAIEPGAFLEGHCKRIEHAPGDTKISSLRDPGKDKPAAAVAGGPLGGGVAAASNQ
jgi:cytoskeletal protein CcmA (bactofilin family)